ncbi:MULTISPECIES: DUF6883 domain-containing protein [unclassified Microcoleus]|uniref:DUF6883 domain-containing protein n=1 Tax=unclassified Microcoleus TaxID=2642155 RepID=UPI00403F0427
MDPRKSTQYPLNLDNAVGSNNAVIFHPRLGLNQENYDLLLAQISTKTLDAEAITCYSTDIDRCPIALSSKWCFCL